MNNYDLVFASKVEANVIESDLENSNYAAIRLTPFSIRVFNVADQDRILTPNYQYDMKVRFARINNTAIKSSEVLF